MNINKIEIRDFASFVGEQVIDVTGLPKLLALTDREKREAILNAICIALYGQASMDISELIRKDVKKAYCKVVFSMADNRSFQAEWCIRRKNDGSMEEPQHLLRQVSQGKGKWETTPVIQECMQTLTGLNCEQFRSTLHIAQEDLAAFLTIPEIEKSNLLEKMTGTEIYGQISQAIYQQTQEAHTTYEKFLCKLEGITHDRLENSELKKHKEALHLAEDKLKNHQQLLEQTSGYIQWYQTYNQTKEQLETAMQEQKEAQVAIHEIYNDYVLLERYDLLTQFYADFQEINEQRKHISKLRELLSQIYLDRDTQLETVNKQKEENSHVNELYNAIHQEYTINLPLLNRAHELQGRIIINRQNEKQREEWFNRQTEQLEKIENTITAQQEQLNVCLETQQAAKLQLQTIMMHQLMNEKSETVINQLKKIGELQHDSQECSKRLTTNEENLSSNQKILDTKQAQRDSILAEKHKLRDELAKQAILKQNLETINLQEKIISLSSNLRDLQDALALWKNMVSCYENTDTLTNGIRILTNEIAELDKTLEKQKEELDEKQRQYNRQNRATQINLDFSIGQLRERMSDGTACPVCGSLQHPYKTQGTELSNDNISRALEEAKESVENSKKEYDALCVKQSNNKIKLTEKQLQLTHQNEYMESLADQWAHYIYLDETFADYSNLVHGANRTLYISQLKDKTAQDLKNVQIQYNEYLLCQKTINEINERLIKLSQEDIDIAEEISNIRSQQNICELSKQELNKQIRNNESTIALMADQLEEIIAISGWRDLCMKDVEALIQVVSSITEKWKQNTQLLQEGEQRRFQLQTELDAMTQKFNDLTQARTDNQSTIQSIQESTKQAENQIKKDFNDKTLEEYTEYIEDQLTNIDQEYQTATLNLNKAQEKLNDLNSQIQAYNHLLKQEEETLHQKSTNMDYRISQFNVNHSPVRYAELEQIFTNTRDWNELRTTVNDVKEKLEKANNKKEQIDKKIVTLMNSEFHPDELQNERQFEAQRDHLLKNIQEEEKEVFYQQVILRKHEDSLTILQNMEEERNQLEEQYLQWKKLDDLIGSIDGNKFREIAQKRILQFITKRANALLTTLKPHFQLQIDADGMTLYIHDKNDTHKKFQALSYAEKYIVSLTLGLGLATLQSGLSNLNNILFIDADNLTSTDFNKMKDVLHSLQQTLGSQIAVTCSQEQEIDWLKI